MYEQFLKTWQIPQTAALQGNPWGNLGSVGTAAAQQAVTLQRQWIGQVTEMCGLKGPARDFTLGMFENASQLYLTAVERQLEWLQSVTTLFAPSAIPSATLAESRLSMAASIATANAGPR